MCGRVNVHDNEGVKQLLEAMNMQAKPNRAPRFNIAPTQPLDVVRYRQGLTWESMSWGVSVSARGKRGQVITKRVPNARDDKVWSSYLWRSLIPEQRVLIPVNGFYEWKRENKKLVQAFYITPSNHTAMFLAGIFREPKGGDSTPEVSIITTAANEEMRNVHDRMPVWLSSKNKAFVWLQETDKDSLSELIKATHKNSFVFTPVSNYVNKSTNEGPECMQVSGMKSFNY